MLRRTFLQTASGLPVIASLAAAPPPQRSIPLGFDTYSLRAFRWKAPQLLEYASSQKLDTIQISSLGDYDSLEPPYLAKIRDKAHGLGIHIDAGIGCICPLSTGWNPKSGDPVQYILKGVGVAKAVGANSMRCFMGASADRRGKYGIAALMENTIKTFRSAAPQARDMGVKIALENHSGDMQAREVRTIIEESGKDIIASCLDTGNPMWVVEDPLVTLEVLGPYVVTTHVRDSVVFEHPRGAAAQWVALGDGIIDFHKFFDRFAQLCPNAKVQLEIITGRPPTVLPYFEDEFWKVFPDARSSEFARFVKLARDGHSYGGFMVIEDGDKNAPEEYHAALKAQQKRDLERSLDYAKNGLGIGIRWRKG
ncbi:MAG TPA: TIM barrel protein [Bryobacteraceae bacterium]|nr:TIM barrel protein [Bryobacteraceae bacterium]